MFGDQLRRAGLRVMYVFAATVGALLLAGWILSAYVASQTSTVEVGPNHTRRAEAGQNVLYNHILTNTGTTTDAYRLQVSSTQNWPVALWEGLYPTETLVLPPGTSLLFPLRVSPYMTASFQVSLTVPRGVAGVTEITIITATSMTSSTMQSVAVDTTIVLSRIYLPLVVKRWPPVPYQPTMNAIENAADGNYLVSWAELPSRLASTYTLQEAADPEFTTNLREVCTTAQQSCPVSGKLVGTYYYRVRGQNNWGYGLWSNIQAARVLYLEDLITEVSVTLPQPLAAATHSFCTWGGCTISPRLYHEPLADSRTLVGWTDSSGNGHISLISGNAIERTFDFQARSIRGLVAHDDGTFAVLTWRSDSKTMWLSKHDENGGEIGTTNLNSDIAVADFWLGGGRLAYGNGMYAAYFTVKGVSGGFTGHYGDQLAYVDDNGAIQAGGWNWGCSHSMAQLVSHHPSLDQFMAVCSSDCYPGKGIFVNHRQAQIYEGDGNCGGSASAQLGQVAPGDGSWKLLFNALDRSCCAGHGIALATIDENYQSSFVWLTNTDGEYERDPAIARLGSGVQVERYLVGWMTTNDGVYWLGVIDGDGNFLAGPEEVTSAGILWGNRDNSFRTRPDGSVSWVQGDPTSTELHLFLFDGSAYR